jgi:AcrR family transcriptional regulator
VITDVAVHGLADRSLRDVAAAVGSSHRMLNYHFGSRPQLVAAIVFEIEARQRQLLLELAEVAASPADLVLMLWDRLIDPAMLPYVRLFFECVATAPGHDLTDPWLQTGETAAAVAGATSDAVDLRLGVAVTRGLLIDVIATGDTTAATAALRRFVELAQP